MRAARRKNLFGFARSRVTYHRDVAAERRQLQREAMEERRRQVQLKKLRAQEIAAEAKIRAAERKISIAEQKIERAAKRASGGASRAAGGLSESEFERIKAHMESEIAKQEDVKKRAGARVAGNPSWGFGIYKGRGFTTEQIAHFKSREAAETYARTHGLTGYSIKRAFDKTSNPAVSAEQYRLAQAVLSGTARDQAMPLEVAREIVDRTPARLRSQYSRRNPGRQLYLDLNVHLHEQPPDSSGMLSGPARIVSRGTPVEVLQKGRGGHRLLVKANYYGTPYYGWVDKERLTRDAGNPNSHVTHTGPVPPSELHQYSEQSMIALMKHDRITWQDFVEEIKRRVAAGESVHPSHRPLANPEANCHASPEYQLGYSLGQRDKETASLHRTAGELDATFLAKFDPERASLHTFTEAYEAGISSGAPAANPPSNPHDLYDRIQEHLTSGGVIAVRTHAKQWTFQPKHAKMFRPGKPGEPGVYMQRGKNWDYVFPQYVHFGRYKDSNPADDLQPRQAGREAARRVMGQGLSVKAIGSPMITKYFNIWWKHEAPNYAGGLADMPPKAESLAAFKRGWRTALNPEPATEPGDESEEYRQAKRLAELFHGRPVKEEITTTEDIRSHDWHADFGPLVELRVKAPRGYPFKTAKFPFSLREGEIIRFQTSPDGKQFYLRGGDQEVDLDALGMGSNTEWFRDSMNLGEVTYFSYQAGKKFHGFKLTEYTHKVGSALDSSGRHVQKTKIKPVLIYDTLSKKLAFAGGQGKVETKHLVDGTSPGIVQ